MTGNFFGRHFDAEIAAGDHDSVGGFENFFQMIDGLRLLELGDDGNVAAVRGDDLLDHADVGGGADEGERDGIDAVAEAEFEVFAIFFCQGGNGERHAGKVDAFVLAEHAAVDDVADDVFAAVSPSNGAHAQFDQAVTRAGCGRRARVRGRDRGMWWRCG